MLEWYNDTPRYGLFEKKKTLSFKQGDLVEINQKDFQGVQGEVLEFDPNKLSVKTLLLGMPGRIVLTFEPQMLTYLESKDE